MYRGILLTISLFLICGCTQRLARVDFKYSNLAHMNVKEAFVDFDDVDPENLIFALSEAFRSKSYEIIDRHKLDFYYAETPTSEKCYEANREIIQQEFLAYQANDFGKYKAIDRESPFLSRGITDQCHILEKVKVLNIKSWFLQVEIPQGDYSTNVTVPEVSSFFLFNGTTSFQYTASRQDAICNYKLCIEAIYLGLEKSSN